MKRLKAIVLLVLCISLSACNGDPKKSFVQALKDCGLSDVNSDKILYFGPSNDVGPGSGWRETFDADGKHVDYRLRFSEADLPAPKNFLDAAAASSYQCKGGKTVSFSLGANVSASAGTLPLSLELSNDLKKAKNVTVSVGGMAWDQVKEFEYETYFKNVLGAGNKYYEDMNSKKPMRLVLYRALAVKDLVMTYDFASDDAAAIKAKYTGPGSGFGNIGGGVSAQWKNTTTLTITAPQKAWILGELGEFSSSSGFAGLKASQPFVPKDIAENTGIAIDRVQ